MLCLEQTMHLSCTDTNPVSKQKESEIPRDPCHLGVPSGVSKMIVEPMVRSTQTVQLSCIKISTVSKWREIPHDQRHLGVPLGASKRFPSLWHVRRKPCSYLASRLALSPNGARFHRPTSPRSSIGCVQIDFRAYDTLDANCAPILHRHLHCLQKERSEIPQDPCHLGVPLGASKRFLSLWHVRRKP